MEADLPDDVAAHRALVLEQFRELEVLRCARAEVERLQVILEAFQRHWFGRHSEQLDYDQLQLGLEEAEAALAQAEVASDAAARRQRDARAHKTMTCPRRVDRVDC